MTPRDRHEQDRAARVVRSSPIFTNRAYVPPSTRYGARWRTLPVESYREASNRWDRRVGWFSGLLALVLWTYMVGRVVAAFL